MNRKKRFIVAVMLVIALITPMAGRVEASFDSYYRSSYRKLLYTTGQYLEGSYRYYSKLYDANSRYTYSYQICRLNTPFMIDNAWKSYRTGDQVISVSQGITISSTSATSTSHSVNASVEAKVSYQTLTKSFAFEAGVSVGYGYTKTKTNSYTTTYQDTQSYSTTFNKNTLNGIYYYAAIRYYDAQEVEVYGRKAYSNDTWRCTDSYTIYLNKYNYPVIKLIKDPL